jgi:hypothetical protein
VDPTRLAIIAMYIAIIQLVYGPAIETAAVTIQEACQHIYLPDRRERRGGLRRGR